MPEPPCIKATNFSTPTFLHVAFPLYVDDSPWIDPLLRKALYHTATDVPPPSFAPISSLVAAHLHSKGVGDGASLYTLTPATRGFARRSITPRRMSHHLLLLPSRPEYLLTVPLCTAPACAPLRPHLAMSSRMTMHPCTMLLRSPYDDDTVTSDRVAPRFSATSFNVTKRNIYRLPGFPSHRLYFTPPSPTSACTH